jgi:hypothetical protein
MGKKRRASGQQRQRMVALALAALVWLAAPIQAAADLVVKPESDTRNDADNAAEKTSAQESFDKSVKDAESKSPAFKALMDKIRDNHAIKVVIHVRKDKTPEVDSALDWNALGVTDLNMTNVLRFPNPDVGKCGDKPAIKMPDGFPPWATTRTEILYHVLDEAYHGALDAAAKKLTGDESDYKQRLAARLETNHETAIKEQAAVRKDFGQTYTVYGQLTGYKDEPLTTIQVGDATHKPRVKFTFLTRDGYSSSNESYLWYEDGLLHFGFYSGKTGKDGRVITEPTIPDGGFAVATGIQAEDQARDAAYCVDTDTELLASPSATAVAMSAVESAVLADINFARGHPKDYADQLATGPQTAATREAIAYLDGLAPLAPLAASVPARRRRAKGRRGRRRARTDRPRRLGRIDGDPAYAA